MAKTSKINAKLIIINDISSSIALVDAIRQQNCYLRQKSRLFYYFYLSMNRYQDHRLAAQNTHQQNEKDNKMPRSFNGNTWDAQHMTTFLGRSNYSNWRGDSRNISKISVNQHKRSLSYRGQHYFRTTKDNKNQSKIGFTPIFPLVSNPPVYPQKALVLNQFLQSSRVAAKEERQVSGRVIKLRCNPQQQFKFQANAIKFQLTDPLTLQHEEKPLNLTTGFQKQRMVRLIGRRHPHGMTGIDHPEHSQSKFYSTYQQNIRVREQPNSHRTFLIDRDWIQKKRSVPPVDDWKERKTITIRKFRNQNAHGYNILTNRLVQ